MNEQGGEPTKVPPHNIEAEQSVIGGILLDNEAEIGQDCGLGQACTCMIIK